MNPRLRLHRLFLLLLGIIILASCTITTLIVRPIDAKTIKVQPDWSRGIAIGETTWNQPPAIATSNGKQVHLAWGDSQSNGVGIHYLQFNERAERVAEQRLTNLEGTPQSIRILLDAQEQPHVFVLARLAGEPLTRVVHWSPNTNGSATPVSPANTDTQSYAVVARQGFFDLFFAGEPESDAPGLYHARLDSDARIIAQTKLNTHPAREVSAEVAQDNTVHLLWGETQSAKTRRVLYQSFPAMPQPTEGTLVGDEIPAPAKIGLEDQRVYALWGQALRGSAQAGGGTGYINLISFPINAPQLTQPTSVNVPQVGQIAFLRYRGNYQLTVVSSATPPPGVRNADLLYAPMPLAGQRGELAMVAIAGLEFSGMTDLLGRPSSPSVVDTLSDLSPARLSRMFEHGLQVHVVPVILLARDGQIVTYQAIGYSNGISFSPTGTADQAGNLYAAWLVGSSWQGYRVYYAATTSGARSQLDSFDLTDVFMGTTSTLWKMLAGLALLPFFPFLVAPALIVAVIYTVFGSRSELIYDPMSYLILLLACLAYWIAKQVILGSVLADPVIAQDLEGWARLVAVWGIQLGIALVAGAITWRQIAQRQINSALWAILLFCAIDMFLTMLVAGPTLSLRG